MARTARFARQVGLAVATVLLLGGCAEVPGSGSDPSDDGASSDSPGDATPGDLRPVTVVAVGTTSGSSVVSAGGFVQGVIETGGTCAFTLTQDGRSVVGRSDAEPDATTTWCTNVDLTLPEPGRPWLLEVEYRSPLSAGQGSVTSSGDLS